MDKPLAVQYAVFLGEVVQGDFGRSHTMNRTARQLLFQAAPATFQLAAAAFLLTVLIGVPLGILSAVKRDTFWDTFGKLFAVLGLPPPVSGLPSC